MAAHPDPHEPRSTSGLRARKKVLTRDLIASTAERLFEQRGFSDVTVAEIADASNVSVKTVFTYFPSKEDLVFAHEDGLLSELRSRITHRPPDTTVWQAVASLISDLTALSLIGRENNYPVDRFWNIIGSSPSLQARLRLMWERYERELCLTLAAEDDDTPQDPRHRVAAAVLLTTFRVLTSADVQRVLATEALPDSSADWLAAATRMVGRGTNEYFAGARSARATTSRGTAVGGEQRGD